MLRRAPPSSPAPVALPCLFLGPPPPFSFFFLTDSGVFRFYVSVTLRHTHYPARRVPFGRPFIGDPFLLPPNASHLCRSSVIGFLLLCCFLKMPALSHSAANVQLACPWKLINLRWAPHASTRCTLEDSLSALFWACSGGLSDRASVLFHCVPRPLIGFAWLCPHWRLSVTRAPTHGDLLRALDLLTWRHTPSRPSNLVHLLGGGSPDRSQLPPVRRSQLTLFAVCWPPR